MKIILDAMGGDNAPLAVLEGAAQAVKEYNVGVTLVGDEEKIRQCARENKISLEGMELVHAGQVIEMCEEPAKAVRAKKDSSLVVGLKMLAEGQGDAFVSAGSTGALHVGTSLLVRTVKGIKRPALATCIPTGGTPYLLLDCGANVECRAPMLDAFATMGSVYMDRVMGIENPTVALVNNGAEESKGTELYREAHQLMKVNPNLNFVGNIEPRDVPSGAANVVVCDGFVGNVILKLSEGMAKTLLKMIKTSMTSNLLGTLGLLLGKNSLMQVKKAMDSEEIGGAPLLGAARPVIKAHGSSKAKGIKNAIRQAKTCVENDLCGTMEVALTKLQSEAKGE